MPNWMNIVTNHVKPFVFDQEEDIKGSSERVQVDFCNQQNRFCCCLGDVLQIMKNQSFLMILCRLIFHHHLVDTI